LFGGGAAPPVDHVPAAGTVTIPADGGIERVAVGDTRLVVEAWPGELNAKRLIVEGRDAAARDAVRVLEGASKVRAVEDGGQWRLSSGTHPAVWPWGEPASACPCRAPAAPSARPAHMAGTRAPLRVCIGKAGRAGS
jgi:hypothetical protein